MPLFHSEPYLQVAGLSHKSALIAWGAFFFRLKNKENSQIRELVDDSDLGRLNPPRDETVGATSKSYGEARVRVYRETDPQAALTFDPTRGDPKPYGEPPVAEVLVPKDTRNYCWVPGLEPETNYWYEVEVNGQLWGEGVRWDWDASKGALRQQGHLYRNRFRTFPHPEEPTPRLSFAVIGDFGAGVKKEDSEKRRQQAVASALRRTCEAEDVRFLVTTGDNIYAHGLLRTKSSGDEDDDWFFTFYQPYRYVINRIPVYPCIGNHDARETEGGQQDDNPDGMDDRQQVFDNFHLAERLGGEAAAGRASLGPGLFYRFRVGTDLELVCLDSSKEQGILGGLIGGSPADGFKKCLLLHPRHRAFIEQAFAPRTATSPRWLVPFFHHPVFCAGPLHGNLEEVRELAFGDPGDPRLSLLDLFRQAGVRLVLTGHEHNFQHCGTERQHFIVTGAAAKRRPDEPKRDRRRESLLRSWSSDCHFVVVTVERDRILVTPRAPDGDPSPDLVRTRYDDAGDTQGPLIGGIEIRHP